MERFIYWFDILKKFIVSEKENEIILILFGLLVNLYRED